MRPCLAEVGLAATDVSPIGVSGPDYMGEYSDYITVPRVVILEPSGMYADPNDYFAEVAEEIGAEVYRGDVYKPESLGNLPTVGLLVLENVLNDVSYGGEKCSKGLARLLEDFLVKGGLVVIIDSISSGNLPRIYQELIEGLNAGGQFELVQNEMDSTRPLERHGCLVDAIERRLDGLGLLDPALVKGLKYAKEQRGRWLVFEKGA